MTVVSHPVTVVTVLSVMSVVSHRDICFLVVHRGQETVVETFCVEPSA
jgi:hypothetical protein